MNIKMLKLIQIVLTILCTAVVFTCVDDTIKETPIFEDVTLIEDVRYSGGTTFHFSAPSDAHYIVLGVFGKTIVTEGKLIVNKSDFEGGSRTGLDGCSRDSVTTLYQANTAKTDFTAAIYSPSGTKHWAVWAFNRDWVIIAASGDHTNNF